MIRNHQGVKKFSSKNVPNKPEVFVSISIFDSNDSSTICSKLRTSKSNSGQVKYEDCELWKCHTKKVIPSGEHVSLCS